MKAAIFDPFRPVADHWPEPDPHLVNGGVRAAPRLPIEAFGTLAPYVRDLAAAKGGPPDYVALALLTAAAGVIGDARAVRVRPGWIEPCALWGLLVGGPSAGKTQPLALLRSAVKVIEPEDAPDFADVRRQWATAAALAREVEAAWKADLKAARQKENPIPPKPADADPPPEPLAPRIAVASVTVEKLSHMFSAFPRGLLLTMDEAAGWLGNFGKYGGDGDAAFYLSAYSGQSVPIDRVREGGSVNPARALLSACGTIQPERLAELLMNRADDGLLARFLVAWPNPVPPVWATRPVDEGRMTDLLRRLRSLQPETGDDGQPRPLTLPLAPDAATAFGGWYERTKTEAQVVGGLMGSFRGKCEGVAARLALVLELLQWAAVGGPEPRAVSIESVAHATGLVEDYFVPMAERVYGDSARPPAERDAVMLLKAIVKRRARTFNARAARRDWGLSGLRDAGRMTAALAVLADGDCIRARGESGPQGGRKPADYEANPWLWGEA